MTILTLNKKELEKKIGVIDPAKEDLITQMGTPVEGSTKEELSVEIFQNRPDLFSKDNKSGRFGKISTDNSSFVETSKGISC